MSEREGEAIIGYVTVRQQVMKTRDCGEGCFWRE